MEELCNSSLCTVGGITYQSYKLTISLTVSVQYKSNLLILMGYPQDMVMRILCNLLIILQLTLVISEKTS